MIAATDWTGVFVTGIIFGFFAFAMWLGCRD